MNRISRRTFLSTTGAAGVALAAAGDAPAVESVTEDAELLRLYEAHLPMMDELRAADAQLQAAQDVFDAIGPKLPDALIWKSGPGKGLANWKLALSGLPEEPRRWIYSSDEIARFHSRYFGSDDPHHVQMRKLHDLAEVYEREWHDARERSGAPAAAERRALVVGAIRTAAADVSQITPKTRDGLLMKASILSAMAVCGEREAMWLRGYVSNLPGDIVAILAGSRPANA
ncbi:twin-arginine translocation signal domain-containing protein [Rhizobium sp. EC-SD404]|uniref:twin-arginine translocation signal domain-containing protein n=1 Tax=Rhizobium sp. EC-SD404 TaxID=2038389 RepID=UPI0012556C13|nr:twin-arginine translocation signal domain-containing protein [Rhizobium sp. EC-SD404]VVT32869.1 exported hypothetical protein [Rhizobium sp. EC-SD404]